MRLLRNLLFIALLLVGSTPGVFAQLWSNQLVSTRAIDWTKAGLNATGGVPSGSFTQSGSTISAYSGNCNTITAAFTAAAANTYVLLGAGTFIISGGCKLQNTNGNVELRGSGPLSTIMVFSSGNACMGAQGDVCLINGFAIGSDGPFAQPPCGGGNSANCADWTAGYSQGATSITLKNVGTNLPPVGSIIFLDQANDATNTAAALIQCDVVGPCSYSGGAFGRVLSGSPARDGGTYTNADYSQTQGVKITSESNASGTWTIGIDPPLEANNWRSGQTPGAWWSATATAGQATAVNLGISSMTLDHCDLSGGSCLNTTQVSGEEILNCIGCWIKNIRSLDSQRNHVLIESSSHTVIRDNYFYLMKSPGTTSYGIEPQAASDALIENNIFEKIASPILLSEGNGMVIGYNFSWNNLYSNVNFMQTSTVHDSGNFMNLFEGNYFNGISDDVAHGTSPLTTIFRNWIPGQEPAPFNRGGGGGTAGTVAIEVEPNGRAVNVIGNVLGSRIAVGGTNAGLPCSTNSDTGGGTCTGASYHTVYETSPNTSSTGCFTPIYLLGWANPNNCTGTSGTSYTGGNDSSVNTSMMRWGNYDTVHNAVQWGAGESTPGAITFVGANTTDTVHVVPPSYYYAAKPSWWASAYSTVPWPPIGPDVTGGVGPGGFAYQNLAYLCYVNSTGASVAYPSSTGVVLNFDANVCYTAVGGGGGTNLNSSALTPGAKITGGTSK